MRQGGDFRPWGRQRWEDPPSKLWFPPSPRMVLSLVDTSSSTHCPKQVPFTSAALPQPQIPPPLALVLLRQLEDMQIMGLEEHTAGSMGPENAELA